MSRMACRSTGGKFAEIRGAERDVVSKSPAACMRRLCRR